MSLFVRQNRRGMGDTFAASFNPAAMRALVSNQRASLMELIRQGGPGSDPTAYDPGYGMFEPPPGQAGSSSDALPWIVGGAGLLVLGTLGVVVWRKRRAR